MNKTLLKSVREYKKQSILTPVFVILEVLMEVLIPFEMANIIDTGITGQDMPYILQRGAILVVLAILALVFWLGSGLAVRVWTVDAAADLRWLLAAGADVITNDPPLALTVRAALEAR